MDEHCITNVYMAYVKNDPYLYPTLNDHTVTTTTSSKRDLPTGWQIIPNLLWRHFCKPKQWYEMCIKYEAYAIDGINITLFNPIPITNQLAIQRTSLFAAFNNCIYCNTYTDTLYETSWHPWNIQTGSQTDHLNLLYKEGVWYSGTSSDTMSDHKTNIYYFPDYYWKRQYAPTVIDNVWSQGKTGSAGVFDVYSNRSLQEKPLPAGIIWDPYERPDEIGELRAGKNATTFTWTPAPCDANKIFNLDRLMAVGPWTPAGPFAGCHRAGTGTRFQDNDPEYATTWGLFVRQGATAGKVDIGPPAGSSNNSKTFWHKYADYTIPNWANLPIVPNTHVWKELQNSIADYFMNDAYKKIDKYWSGLEGEQFLYPPHQCFIKGIPIYSADNNIIQTLVQLSCKVTLKLKCKPRRTAYYTPTWGPFSGEQLYYHNPTKLIFQEPTIRYKTGGMRRSWQNAPRTINTSGTQQLWSFREDPYASTTQTDITNSTYTESTYPIPLATGQGGLRTTQDPDDDNRDDDNIQITLEQGGKSTVRFTPKPKERKTQSPDKYADVQMMEHISQL